jgi:HEAT repeat protein
MTQHSTLKASAASLGKTAKPTVKSLIGQLASDDGIARVKARRDLVSYKAKAVTPLVEALSDKRHWVRWEAAKALSQIGNQDSIQALLEALSDKDFDVRWLAAEGLIRIGRKSIIQLLTSLVEHSDSIWLREGIHHVLYDMRKRGFDKRLQPVLAALEGSEPSLEVPVAARAAVGFLENS